MRSTRGGAVVGHGVELEYKVKCVYFILASSNRKGLAIPTGRA